MCQLWSYLPYLSYSQFDLSRCLIRTSDNWVSFSTELNCQITLHIDLNQTIIFRLFSIVTIIFSLSNHNFLFFFLLLW